MGPPQVWDRERNSRPPFMLMLIQASSATVRLNTVNGVLTPIGRLYWVNFSE
jgi:hypothetical protein